MKNNKGFTLVEVIAAVVLLILITLLVVPKVKTMINESKDKAYNSIVETLESAAESYTLKNTAEVNAGIASNGYYDLTVLELKLSKLIDDDIVNPKTDIKLSNGDTVRISKTGNIYTFTYNNDTEYISDGLVLWYDAINNTTKGHSTTATTWKDLSGNGNNGTINGATWSTNYLSFDGTNDWVSMGQLNQNTYTIEVVANPTVVSSGERILIGNYDSGGYGLTYENGKITNLTYISTYRYLYSTNSSVANVKYNYVGTYDGSKMNLYINGKQDGEANYSGNITAPGATVMALGTNPTGNTAAGGYFSGKIYSVRIYNRALTADEVLHNYEVDKARFGL